jgi:putative ABC transport system permease protein
MSWLQRLFKRDRLERELDAELRDHFDRLVADYKAAGKSDAEARRLARLEFGGDDSVKEACRDARGTRWVEESIQDARYGIRGFRKNPGFACVAIVTLAIGIGASLAIFSVVDALLLRPLPVPHARELVTLSRWLGDNYSESFSYPQVRELADRRDVFASLCGIGTETVYVGPPDDLQPAGVAWVSGGYFETLGLTPVAGRLLNPSDDERGAAPAVVISHGFWQRRFGGDRNVIGTTLTIDGQAVPIAGITPPGFNGAAIGESADLTLAINAKAVVQPETEEEGWTTADARWLLLLARPAADIPEGQLQSRVDVIWPAVLEHTTPARVTGDARKRAMSMTLRVDPGQAGASRLRRELRSPLVVGMALVMVVLLIACVNVANLLLARGAGRAREVSMRLALGAGRGRIIRQRLIESALLAAAGTALGVLAGWSGSTGLVQLIAERAAGPDASLLAIDVDPNWRLLIVSVAVMAAATILFGLLPALRASHATTGALAGSTRVAESRTRFATALIVAQVALSLLLVIAAGLFTRSVHNLRTIDRGFTPGNVLLADYDPRRAVSDMSELLAFNTSVLDSVRSLPGVGAASLAAMTPLQGGGMSTPMKVNGESTEPKEIYFNVVAPRFFEILDTPLIAGRDLSPGDDLNAPAVTVVNEAFVRTYLTGASPLGQRVAFPDAPREMEIVGVVKDAVYETLRAPAPPTIYMSYVQARPRPMTLVVDATAPVSDVAAAVRRAIQPRVPAAPMRIRTFASQIENSRAMFEARLMRMLTAIFGAIALALAAIGLYGLMSYNVALRTREIGVRLALGARPARVMRMIVGSALRMVAIGVIAGLPIAWFASRLITRLVFGVTPTDPATIAAAIAILATVGLASAALPARRAATVDPVASIHVE